MIKKLLKKINNIFISRRSQNDIEKYLANSIDLIDLEQKMNELDKKGAYCKFYI